MKPLKHALRNLLLSFGYDVRKTSHIGLNSHFDLRRIFAERSIRTIFDVGAHVGESALQYVEEFPDATIYCFEPSPATFATLRANLQAWPKVQSVNQAVGDRCGGQTLFVNQSSVTNSLLESLPDITDSGTRELLKPAGRTEVVVTTLDAFCQQNAIAAIDLLKLDVQGFEAKVLAGASHLLTGQRIAAIYTEVTFESHYANQTTWLDLYATLAQHGFQFVDFYSQTRNLHHATRWCDALFINSKALESAALERS